ncbi:hypothetical protein SAMN02927937_02559 [Paenimyroides aquimaris]|uniref:Lipoprotein n=1 Tax=Paenimyroides marinum TaxID=1159016 RepID=A0A1H6MHI9_9FLAO|nr:hypothetical protein [Paenimyroides aquimaris]SEH98737.1 hypothetical protein SAMN02927937_02559 [Paenimyroides aquimaris]
MNRILLFLILISFTISCGNSDREKQLHDRERALQIRIDSFAAKENEYRALLQMKDSIAVLDSIKKLTDSINLTAVKPWADSLAGKWNGRLICVESNCNDYVIGDQRVNTWNFANDTLKLYASLLNNKNEIVRTYDAVFNGDDIVLSHKTDPSVAKNVQIRTILNNIQKDKLTGTYTIIKNNDCIAKFSIEFTRPSNRTK